MIVTVASAASSSNLVNAAGSANGAAYRPDPGSVEHVLLARLTAGDGGRPVFLAAGQRPVTHRAAVRHLVRNRARLGRKYGAQGSFCLLLKVVNSKAYGPDLVELVADVTKPATSGAARPRATAKEE